MRSSAQGVVESDDFAGARIDPDGGARLRATGGAAATSLFSGGQWRRLSY
jgi:hypothetical protein